MLVTGDDDLDPNLDGSRVTIGICIAAFMPVPRIAAKRVAGSRYARARRAEEESLIMASRRTLSFYRTKKLALDRKERRCEGAGTARWQAFVMVSPRSQPMRSSEQRNPLPIPSTLPLLIDV